MRAGLMAIVIFISILLLSNAANPVVALFGNAVTGAAALLVLLTLAVLHAY